MPYYILLVLFLFLGLLSANPAQAQGPGKKPAPAAQDSAQTDTSKIEIIFIKRYRREDRADGEYQELLGEVHLRQDQVHFWCDTAFISPNKKVLARGEVQMLQDDSIRIYSDTLHYDGLSRQAKLRRNVVLEDNTAKIFTEVLDYDLREKIATFPTGWTVVSDSAQIISKKGSYNAKTSRALFQDSVRLTHPQFKLIADSLAFNTRTEQADFLGPTFIYNEEKLLYCETGFFDTKAQKAEFAQNAYYVNRLEDRTEKASADRILYDGKTEDYYLIGNAVYQDGRQEVKADTIYRQGETGRYFFRGKPQFRSMDSTQTQTIVAENSFYDKDTETMQFRGEVVVTQENQLLLADSLDFNEKSKKGEAKGRVVWLDTLQNTTIYCGRANYNDSTKTLVASENPVMATLVEGDTLWLSADTLYSVTLGQFDSTLTDSAEMEKRILLAYHGVKLFKSNLQGVCDSLVYSEQDSIFKMFRNPVLWSDSVQFTADTLLVELREQKLHRILQRHKAFIANTEDSLYFNQIKGRNIVANFAEGRVSDMLVQGNAESVYYVRDDKYRYVGVNDVDCANMHIYFGRQEIERIKFLSQPKAVLYPMGQADHEKLKLEGFTWLDSLQPKGKPLVYYKEIPLEWQKVLPENLSLNPPAGEDDWIKDDSEPQTPPSPPLEEPKPSGNPKTRGGADKAKENERPSEPTSQPSGNPKTRGGAKKPNPESDKKQD